MKTRAQLERAVARAQGELDRAIDALIKSEVEADARLPELRAARDAVAAALAASEAPPRVVALHPSAVDDYLKNLDRLAELIGRDLQDRDEGLAQVLRRLISTMTVMLAPAGQKPDLRIAGHLASLIEHNVFPQCSIAGGRMVAEEGFEPPTHGL